MKLSSVLSVMLGLVVGSALASGQHDAGMSRRHHQLEQRGEEFTPLERDVVANGTLAKRAFVNARASWYEPGLGACGGYNGRNDPIVALNMQQFGGGYPGRYCGRRIIITYRGTTRGATIRDRCVGCGYAGIDMSPGLFSQFASLGAGIIRVTWDWADGSGGGGGGGGGGQTSTSSRRRTTTTRSRTSTRPPTTPTPTHTPTHTPTSTSSHTSTSAAPTPTHVGPENIDEMFQALLGMTALLKTASDLTRAA